MLLVTLKDINILFVIALIIYVWRVSKGAKEGLIGETAFLADTCIICFLVVDAVVLINSILNKNTISILTSAAVLLIVLIGRKVIHSIFGVLKLIGKLPLINSLNTFLGIAAGMLEATLIIWTIYAFLPNINAVFPGNHIMLYVEKNTFLRFLYENNGLGNLVRLIASLFVPR
ncbi:MAG: hypothetical protein K6E48_07450 [Lachnospiraceae bacterium]|jgi:hypothetical protein|nr:hypothetical protein [Lachnospiraceae bacterium]MCR5321026.1 hypothetical protein [Lachnospiraceae bacterium]